MTLLRFYIFSHRTLSFAKLEINMLDFYQISYQERGKDRSRFLEVYPDFQVFKSKDLMVRGGVFYGVWDEEQGRWSRNELDIQKIVDGDLYKYAESLRDEKGIKVGVKYLKDFQSGSWTKFRLFLSKLPDSFEPLDASLVFANTDTKKEDHSSRQLPYPLETGETPAFDALFGVLYSDEELQKIMWAFGSVIAGESRNIQKFYVLFGLPGTGKSTVLNLAGMLFDGYDAPFTVSTMATTNNAFALEPLRDNPLVAFDHEGDLSSLRVNSMLTSVVSHDVLSMNVKYQHAYSMRLHTALFVATNKPVVITDRGSGLLRRLIDIRPTGTILPEREYRHLMTQLEFELGAIAHKCLSIYQQLGPTQYSGYVPLDMMYRTNTFLNFVDEYIHEFSTQDWTTLSVAWRMYKEYCENVGITKLVPRHVFRDEFRNYWKEFHPVTRIEGKQIRSVYKGFDSDFFYDEVKVAESSREPEVFKWLELSEQESALNRDHATQPAQLASLDGPPQYKWTNVKTALLDIDTEKLHYVLPKEDLITIDFDVRDANGDKSLALNIAEASKFPPTYAEVSKGGEGLHLHYFYSGNIDDLSRSYSDGIEVLKPIGHFSIRRRLTLCNDHAISTINSGLPLKPKRGKMLDKKTLTNEKQLRSLIMRNLKREIHAHTKPSVDFIDSLLWEAYEAGIPYDVTNLRPHILEFASNSTNNAEYCIETAINMKYKSEDEVEESPDEESPDDRLVFFDVEVLSNLFGISWKFEGSETVNRMINPSAADVEQLTRFKLVGFNNRRFDNHILFAAILGYDLERLHRLSQTIISGKREALFREAYRLSYADVYDYTTKKQNLKEWEVELGIAHIEPEVDWNEPLPEERWEEIMAYCDNDVIATEAVHHARAADFRAREILAEISGLKVNHSTLAHSSKIVFGDTRKNHKSEFVYPDLSQRFPGYVFDKGKSIYRGEEVGEGGYVWAQPGMYNDVLYMDVASMHPTSIVEMNLFGRFTIFYAALKEARMAIKERRLDDARGLFDGALSKYLEEEGDIDGLAYALKIVLNIVYGYTAARFNNAFRDSRNKDNVVAKRGALFMVDLKNALLERGCNPIHFKTDSVKIADYDESDIEFVIEFGKQYGYDFGVEGIYDRLVLINDAVLIGRIDMDGHPPSDPAWSPVWDAVGARFAEPYVYKTLFSKEPIDLKDLSQTRSVKKGVIYLQDDDGVRSHIGRVGVFCPVLEKGGELIYVTKTGKEMALSGTKGYKWLPIEVVEDMGLQDHIDLSYFDVLVEEAQAKIAEFGDLTMFLGE